MRTVQDILFDVDGQSLYHDCAEGRPSSVVSVEVFRWNYSDDVTPETAVGSPAVEANPNTTVDAASGAGQSDPTMLSVTATTGFAAERTYLVTGADGYREWIEVAGIDAGVSVTAKHPLHNAYAVGDTVQSTRITADLDASWVADLNKVISDAGPNPAYRVRWVYVVDGVTHVADTYFNLVRYAGRHGVRPQDIEVMNPGWLDRLPTDHRNDQGRRLIDDAYRAVKLDLHSVGIDDAGVAESEVVDELTRWRTMELSEMSRIMAGGASSTQGYELARAAYRERLDSFARLTVKAPIRDHTGGAKNTVSLGLTRR